VHVKVIVAVKSDGELKNGTYLPKVSGVAERLQLAPPPARAGAGASATRSIRAIKALGQSCFVRRSGFIGSAGGR
jgi:hypothetical protein